MGAAAVERVDTGVPDLTRAPRLSALHGLYAQPPSQQQGGQWVPKLNALSCLYSYADRFMLSSYTCIYFSLYLLICLLHVYVFIMYVYSHPGGVAHHACGCARGAAAARQGALRSGPRLPGPRLRQAGRGALQGVSVPAAGGGGEGAGGREGAGRGREGEGGGDGRRNV